MRLVKQVILKTVYFLFKNFMYLVLLFLFIELAFINLRVITNNFTNEYREGAVVLNTYLMINGGNPYSLYGQPQYTNVYGIFYHFIVYPFAKIFGATLLVHRAVSAFFILTSCFVLFLTMRWMKISLLLALAATIIFYGHLLFFTTSLARPDSLGLFLFLCGILIPWRYNYSIVSLITSIALGIFGFLAKPYFIVVLPYLAIYIFLFKSKIKGVVYIFLSSISLLSAVLVINVFFECYFNNTFFIHLNLAGNSLSYANKQVLAYIQYNFGTIIILFCFLAPHLLNLLKFKTNYREVRTKLINRFNLSNFKKPLIDLDVNLFGFCLVSSILLFYFKLGQHSGSWLVYIHQLISSFLLFVVFDIVKRRYKINIILLCLIAINLLNISSSSFLPELNYNLSKWKTISALTSQHQNIFNSPAITSVLIEQGKKVYDSGQSEYFVFGAKRNSFLEILFPLDQRIEIRNAQFLEDVKRCVESRKYDLVVLTKDNSPFISEKLLKKYYAYQETLPAPMPFTLENFALDVWKPKVREINS